MKKLLVLLMAASAPVFAQFEEHALFGEDDQWNLYTQPQLEWTEIGGSTATFGGATFGTVWNDQWRLGLRLSALMSDVRAGDEWSEVDLDAFGTREFGLDVGFITDPNELWHMDLGFVLSMGELDGDGSDSYITYVPSLAACLNLHSTWEMGLQIEWREAYGVGLYGLEDSDLSGVGLSVFFRATEF